MLNNEKLFKIIAMYKRGTENEKKIAEIKLRQFLTEEEFEKIVNREMVNNTLFKAKYPELLHALIYREYFLNNVDCDAVRFKGNCTVFNEYPYLSYIFITDFYKDLENGYSKNYKNMLERHKRERKIQRLEKESFLSAFINKNDLGVSLRPDQKGEFKELSKEELEVYRKAFDAQDKVNYNRKLYNPDNNEDDVLRIE